MKKLIPLLLLLASFANPTFSQSDSAAKKVRFDKSQIKIWITPSQEAKVFQLYDDYRALKVGFQFLQQENKALRLQLDSLNIELDRLIQQQEKQIEQSQSLKNRLQKEIKMRKGYRDLAYKKSLEAQKAKTWRGKYHAVLAFKVSEMIIVNALFTLAIIFFTNNL